MTAVILPFPPVDPPRLPAWECYCGKRSVGAACWNCRQPRPAGAVDDGREACYDSGVFGLQGAERDSQGEVPPGPLEAVVKGKFVNSAHSWAGLSAPSDEGFQPEFSPVLIGRSANGPMAFKGF